MAASEELGATAGATAVTDEATADKGESAILVPVEVPMPIRRLRDGMDYAASVGVPAHVTLLYPFMPPAQLDDAVHESVRRTVQSEPEFSLAFQRVGRWPNVVYLAPEPEAPFRRLTRALAAAFPEYPPYGGVHADVVPHLTVVESPRADYRAAAEHALPSMLPFRVVCREAQVITRPAGGGRWAVLWRLPLAPAHER